MLFSIIKSDIIKIICILFVYLSSINLENFKDRALIIPEILEFIELHTVWPSVQLFTIKWLFVMVREVIRANVLRNIMLIHHMPLKR